MKRAPVESLLKKRSAELARLKRIAKKIKAGGRMSAADSSWVADLLAADRGADRLADGTVPTRILAKLLGVTERTIFTLRKEGIPHEGRDEYPLAEVVPWFIGREVKKRDRRRAAHPGLEDRLRAEKLREARRNNDLKEGRVLPLEDVVAWAIDIARTLRAELEAVGKAHGKLVMRDILDAVERFEAAREQKYGE